MGDDNSSSILKLIAGIAITCGLITFGFLIYNQAKSSGDKIANKTINMASSIAESDITQYDGETVSGSQVINLVKTYTNNGDKITIGVDNGTGTYLYYVYEKDLIDKSTLTVAEMKDIADQTHYVNPTSSFLGEIIRNPDTDAILGLWFKKQ